MEVFFVVLAIIAAGAALVYFLNSSMGMQLVHKKTVSTILNDVTAIQRSAPQTPLHEIYESLPECPAQKGGDEWQPVAKRR